MKSAIRQVAPFLRAGSVPALALGAALTALTAAPWIAGAQDRPPPPREPEEQAKDMIVMVRGTLGGTPTFGAGILVGSRSDRLYIATANHVVRRGLEEAEDLRVELRTLPGEAIEANLLEHADESLDLAVLNVPGLSEHHISVEGLPFDLLGDPDGLERGDPVFHVGNPNGTEWRSNVTPDAVSRVVGTEIRFESYSVAPGSSGGGLFDHRWNLVGLVRADQPPDAVAIPIDIVLGRLEGWGYPVDLAPRAPADAGRETAGEGGRPRPYPIHVLGVPDADAAISKLRAAGYRASLDGPEGRPADEYQVISVGSRVPLGVAQEVIGIARRALPNLRYVIITEDRPRVARAGGTIGGRDVRQEISLGVTNRVLEEFSRITPMPEGGFTRLMAAEDDATFTRVVRAYYSVE